MMGSIQDFPLLVLLELLTDAGDGLILGLWLFSRSPSLRLPTLFSTAWLNPPVWILPKALIFFPSLTHIYSFSKGEIELLTFQLFDVRK
jgi:hypothetical protein